MVTRRLDSGRRRPPRRTRPTAHGSAKIASRRRRGDRAGEVRPGPSPATAKQSCSRPENSPNIGPPGSSLMSPPTMSGRAAPRRQQRRDGRSDGDAARPGRCSCARTAPRQCTPPKASGRTDQRPLVMTRGRRQQRERGVDDIDPQRGHARTARPGGRRSRRRGHIGGRARPASSATGRSAAPPAPAARRAHRPGRPMPAPPRRRAATGRCRSSPAAARRSTGLSDSTMCSLEDRAGVAEHHVVRLGQRADHRAASTAGDEVDAGPHLRTHRAGRELTRVEQRAGLRHGQRGQLPRPRGAVPDLHPRHLRQE